MAFAVTRLQYRRPIIKAWLSLGFSIGRVIVIELHKVK
jgi:hypothetical protein